MLWQGWETACALDFYVFTYFCCFIKKPQLSALDVSRRKWITLLSSKMTKSSSCISNDLTPCIQWGYKVYFVSLGPKAPSDWPLNAFWLVIKPAQDKKLKENFWKRRSKEEGLWKQKWDKGTRVLRGLQPLEWSIGGLWLTTQQNLRTWREMIQVFRAVFHRTDSAPWPADDLLGRAALV